MQFLRQLLVLLRGRPLHGDKRFRPFFIVGSARSGTTLLRAVLEAHPDIHIPPETSALPGVILAWRLYGRFLYPADLLRVILARFEYQELWDTSDLALGPLFRQLRATTPAEDLASVLDAIYRTHAARFKPSAIRWGDKTPANTDALPAIYAVFPDMRAIHLVRDGRDVVRSYMMRSSRGLTESARKWSGAMRKARAFGARYPSQYLEIRYEELVRHPQDVLPRVLDFLHLAFDDRVLRHHELDLRLPDVEQIPELRPVLAPLHDSEVGRWREFFTPAQVAELDRVVGQDLEALGYGRP